MLKEYHYDHLLRWPKKERAAVFFTFDFQGGEDVKPDKNGVLNYESWSQGEYGPHHAIYRLLRILKEEGIKSTFMTCGAIAERFPEAIEAIIADGHVVEGHGYNHEIARYLPRDQEDAIMKKTIAMHKQRAGRRPLGWRSCTQSVNTIELLIENGFAFNTNCFHAERPFLWENNGKAMIETYARSREDSDAILRQLDANGMGSFPPFLRMMDRLGEMLNVLEDGIVPPAAPPSKGQRNGRGWYDAPPHT